MPRSVPLAVLALALALILPTADGEKPYDLDLLEKAPQGWDLDAFLERSTRESEVFRRGLLEPLAAGPAGVTRARLLAEAIVRFRDEARPHLEGRRSLAGFTQPAAEIAAWIAGRREAVSGKEVYGGFSGRWHGLWEAKEVDHHWGDYVELAPARVYDSGGKRVSLEGYQYAWVGDGYGINQVASVEAPDGKRRFLLGYVVHLKGTDLAAEVARRPHAGVPAGKGKIIWLTAGEVFLEESFRTEGGGEAYAITGFFYKLDGGVLEASRGFQAVYSRRPAPRTPWFGFPLALKVEARSIAGSAQGHRRF